MISAGSPPTQWGKLTSLNPNFQNIGLSENTLSLVLFEECTHENYSNDYKCQIYQEKEDSFIQYTGNNLSVIIEDQIIKEGQAFKISSGEKVVFIVKKKQDEMKIEYIFSLERIDRRKDTLKIDREENEEFRVLKKKMKFDENLKDEVKCILCCKMTYGCVSVVPCLHSFCMHCFMFHLTGSQECPQCGVRFIEFRKNVFLNNIIEAYEESGNRKDRSQEECREIRERLEAERIFARFEYENGDIYEGEWKKCRKDGRGRMIWNSGNVYEGEWAKNEMEGSGRMMYKNGDSYEGNWKNS